MALLPYKFQVEQLIAEGRVVQPSINSIRTWLVESTTIPELSDATIALFLLSCDGAIELTKTTIKAYFKIKSDTPDMFNGRDIDSPDLHQAINTTMAVSIPERMPGNDVIHFFNLRDTNYRNFQLVPIMKLAYMIIDISQRHNPPTGLIVIIDMKGLGLMHLTKLKLGAIKRFLEFLQEAMPLKIRTINILNANYVFDRILALIRHFMKSELMAILKTYPPGEKTEEFCRLVIPKRCLPKEYGGELPSCDELNQVTVEQCRELKEFFEAEEALRRKYVT